MVGVSCPSLFVKHQKTILQKTVRLKKYLFDLFSNLFDGMLFRRTYRIK